MKSRVFGLSLATFLAMTAAASAADVVADQGVLNGASAPVVNSGTINFGGHVGDAFSAAVSATGAAAQVSVTNVNQGSSVDGAVAAQDARNDGTVSNIGAIIAGPVAGAGSSVTISAVGSAASVTNSSIGGTPVATVFGNQTSFNSASVTNNGAIATSGNVGEAISVSISGIGAIAQASVSNINGSNALSGLTNVSATTGKLHVVGPQINYANGWAAFSRGRYELLLIPVGALMLIFLSITMINRGMEEQVNPRLQRRTEK